MVFHSCNSILRTALSFLSVLIAATSATQLILCVTLSEILPSHHPSHCSQRTAEDRPYTHLQRSDRTQKKWQVEVGVVFENRLVIDEVYLCSFSL